MHEQEEHTHTHTCDDSYHRTGGPQAYLTDNLDARGRQYQGTCRALDVTCTNNQGAPNNPFNCTYLDSTGGKVEGDMSDVNYRRECEVSIGFAPYSSRCESSMR